jgi:deoxycytidylate deaminase
MAEAALDQEQPFEEGLFAKFPRRSIDIVRGTHTSELVFALCGPIGSPIHTVAGVLKTLLEDRFEYECVAIKLSAFIEKFAPVISMHVDSNPRFKRVKSLINVGDALREKFGSGVLAELAIREISAARNRRKEEAGTERFEPARVCHIIDSVKNQEELDLLRLVYRDMLHCIGVGSPMSFREESLKKEGMSQSDIYELVDQDSGEEFSHGQTVRDTYPQSDFFLRADTNVTESLSRKVERYLNTILATKIETPTKEESAMFMAASAAANSACLSRQVGAAITDKDGDVLAVGWNDVPKADGGVYCSSNNTGDDMRCKNLNEGVCQSSAWKEKIAGWIADSLVQEKLIPVELKDDAVSNIVGSRVKDLLEFSRAIHAEMHAIILGAQKTGGKMVGGKLFCTTYPCHQCARHIVLAGIKDVYYIEPYRKSLATMLHSDSISENEKDREKVRILPFDGIAPNKYIEVFRMREDSRKRNGKAVIVNPRDAALKVEISLESLPVLEATVVKNLREKKLE